MKNTRLLTAFITLSVLFISCAKELETKESGYQSDYQVVGSKRVMVVGLSDDTKMSHELSGVNIQPTWSVGDRLRVYVTGGTHAGQNDTGAWVIAAAEDIFEEGKSARFTNESSSMDETSTFNIFYATYPGLTQGANSNVYLDTQDGTYQNLPEYLTASGCTLASSNVSLIPGLTYFHFVLTYTGTEPVNYKNAYLIKTDGSTDVLNRKGSSPSEKGFVKITPASGFAFDPAGDKTADFYVAAAFDGNPTGSQYKLVFTNADYANSEENDFATVQNSSFTWTATKNYANGHVYKSTANLSAPVTGLVGAVDNTNNWWTAFSDYYTIPLGKALKLQFLCYGNKDGSLDSDNGNNHNWNLVLTTNADRGAGGYAEYYGMTSDHRIWSTGFSADCSDTRFTPVFSTGAYPDGYSDFWTYYHDSVQDGMDVTMTIERTNQGTALFAAEYKPLNNNANNDFTFYEYYSQKIEGTEDIRAFLATRYCHYIIQGISTYDSTTSLSYLQSDYYVASDNINLATVKGTVSDAGLLGHYAWHETSTGVGGTHYVCEVPMDPSLLSATVGTIDASQVAGVQTVINGATYNSSAIDYHANVIKGKGALGSPSLSGIDLHNALAHLTSGQEITYYMYVYSAQNNGTNSPMVYLNTSTTFDANQGAFVRMDNWIDAKTVATGWGNAWTNGKAFQDWTNETEDGDWTVTFTKYQNRAKVTLKIINCGDDTVSIQYAAKWINGKYHYDNFRDIPIDSDNVYHTLNINDGYIVIVDSSIASANGWPGLTDFPA